MQPSSASKEVAHKLAELQISFPSVAPRLLLNLQLDRDPYHGFDTPVLKTIAKHQVPFLLERYVELGAFVEDESKKCGYRALQERRITDSTGKDPAQKAKYFLDFAEIVAEGMAEGNPNKMAALSIAMTPETFEALHEKVLPILRELKSEPPGPNSVGVRVLFGTVLETGS